MATTDPTELALKHEFLQKEEFIRSATAVAEFLESSEAYCHREMSKFTLHEFEPPLHMPEEIQRFREVMVPISSVEVSCDAAENDVRWALEIVLESEDGSFSKSFRIYYDETEERSGYVMQEGEGEPTELPPSEINRMLVDLSLSRDERIRKQGIDLGAYFDASDPTQAKYIRETLAARPHVQHTRERYYDLAEPLGADKTTVEFVVQKKAGEVTAATLHVQDSSLDGLVERQLSYNVGFEKADSHDSQESPYHFSIDNERKIDLGDAMLQADDPISDTLAVEHGLVMLKGVMHVYGIDDTEVIAVDPKNLQN